MKTALNTTVLTAGLNKMIVPGLKFGKIDDLQL